MKMTIKRRISGILLSLALMLGMLPVLGLSTQAYAAETATVTWAKDDLKDPEQTGDDKYQVRKDSVTLTADFIGADSSGNVGIGATASDGTFTVDGGSVITKIEITRYGQDTFDGSGWSYVQGTDYVNWEGNAGSVVFRGSIANVREIKFTIGPALVEYPVWVGDRQVTNYNNDDVFDDGKVSFKPSVDGGSATLILNNYSSSVDSSHENCGIYIGAGVPDLVINLQGDNDVRGSGLYGRGVYSESGNLTFSGDGTLNAYGQNSGIYASAGNLSVRGATLKVSSGNYNGYGIYAGSNVTIYSGNVTASATVGNESYGIYAKGGIVTINGGAVVAAGGRQAVYDIVQNADAGIGWTDAQGASAENTIDINRDGQRLSEFRKVQFPAYAGEPVGEETSDTNASGSANASGSGSSASTGVKSVNTGDETDLRAWTVLFCAALAGTAGMAFAIKRRGE